MEEARTILRTAVRTLHPTPPLAALLLDTLIHHTVLHLDDFYTLTTIPQKELRGYLQPLRAARLIHVHSRREHQLQTQRDATREYYYIHYSDAVNTIKYRLNKLRTEIQNQYLTASGPETLKCPRCGSTWNELDIIPTTDGNLPCPKCNYPDVGLNEAAFKNQGAHESIQRLNNQLAKFNALFAAFDTKLAANQFRDLKFEEQFSRRKIIPREAGGRSWQWTDVKRGREREAAAGAVDENALDLHITSAAKQAADEKARERERKEKVAAANAKPEWIQGGVVRGGNLDIRDDSGAGAATAVKTEAGASGVGVGAASSSSATKPKKEEEQQEDEKKPLDLLNAATTSAGAAASSSAATPKGGATSDADRAKQALMEQYMLDMQREQAELEAARRKREAANGSDAGSDGSDEEDEEDEDDEFEDVPGTDVGTPAGAGGASAMGTPASSQGTGRTRDGKAMGKDVPRSSVINGLKREYDEFDESSDAATPMSVSDDHRDRVAAKRLKVKEELGRRSEGDGEVRREGGGDKAGVNGKNNGGAKAEDGESDDDDDDEVEFEDA